MRPRRRIKIKRILRREGQGRAHEGLGKYCRPERRRKTVNINSRPGLLFTS